MTAMTTSEPKPITSKKELEQLEARVVEGAKAFLEVGAVLIEIRERKGYQLRGFETFEEYCEARFGFTVRHGQRMIAAAQTVKALQAALPEQGKRAIPANEAVARALTPVAESPALVKRVAARLEKAGTTIARASAAQVEKVVAAVTGQAGSGGNGAKPGKATILRARPLPSLSDTCPKCGKQPASYARAGNFWQCGECHAPVLIGVTSASPATCRHCGAAVMGESEFCDNCGGLL